MFCVVNTRSKIFVFITVLGIGSTSSAQTPTPEEIWQIVQQQQKTIDTLQTELDETQKKLDEALLAVETTADAIEVASIESKKMAGGDRTSIGGYGELHYNNLNDDATADGDDSVNRADFHRFVLYFGHEFSDDVRFFSELELEHSLAGESTPGEVELEQAWIELDLNQQHRLRAGLDILPIGILNSTHEPNTFYGVERNRVESEIIPATWWEAGIGLNGEIAPGWNYDFVLHSGLAVPITGSSAFRPRSGRLKVAEADDQDLATTGRIRYTGIPGLEVGVSAQYQADITGTADAFDISASLLVGHVDWKHHSGFGLRALYARWDLGNDTGLDPAVFNANNLTGWYIEPSYRFKVGNQRWNDFGVFTRYSMWDERNQIAGSHRYEEFGQFVAGINWWPHSNLAFKVDFQWEDADRTVGRVLDGVNLGVGYQF